MLWEEPNRPREQQGMCPQLLCPQPLYHYPPPHPSIRLCLLLLLSVSLSSFYSLSPLTISLSFLCFLLRSLPLPDTCHISHESQPSTICLFTSCSISDRYISQQEVAAAGWDGMGRVSRADGACSHVLTQLWRGSDGYVGGAC